MKSNGSSTALGQGEQAELARQGAKAAARGDGRGVNPLDTEANSPPSTGESADTWLARRSAWQAGYDIQTRTARDERAAHHPGRPDEHD